VLARKIILVEGPSDELIVQRAFFDKHQKLPIEAGIDVINVRGLSFKRFLDIAVGLKKRVLVVTDNDGKTPEQIAARFAEYTDGENMITIHSGSQSLGRTLEPQVVTTAGRDNLNSIFGTEYSTDEELVAHMEGDKTAWALRVFESKTALAMPNYIVETIES
jgi:predicted ATP-dependent endonuclease of OLD family